MSLKEDIAALRGLIEDLEVMDGREAIIRVLDALEEAQAVIQSVATPIEKTVYRYGAMADRDDPPYPVRELVEKDDAKAALVWLEKYGEKK